MTEEEQDEESKTETARPSNCQHWFCLKCIQQWSQIGDNCCPLCKVEYDRLLIFKNGKLARKEKVKKKIQIYEGQELLMEYADACYVCGIGEECEEDSNRLLVCDSCDYRICHLICAGLDSVPAEEWLCIDCIANPPIGGALSAPRRRRRRRYRARRQPGDPVRAKKRRRRRRKNRSG